MTQNKVNSTVVKNPNNVVAAARAAEEAKAPKEATKEPVSDQDKLKAFKNKARLNREDWRFILDYKEANKLTADDISGLTGTTSGNVYQWANKFKAEDARLAEENAKKKAEEEAKQLTPTSVIENTKKLLEGVDAKLAAYDAKIAEAKAIVDGAAAGRKAIEDSKAKYQSVIDILSEAK